MAAYGYQAKQTYGYGTQTPAAPKVTTVSPYTARNAKQTGSGDALYPDAKPIVYPGGAPTATATQPTPAAPAPAKAPSSATPPVPQAQSTPLYDYTTDPVLQQVQAQSAQASADADAAALEQKKQLAIQYSDPALATSLGDTATAEAASQNPYGYYNQLATQQPKDALALDETLNKGNLFYSGARINQQSDLANAYGQQRATAAGNEQTALGQIDQQRAAAQLAAQQAVQQANSDAYNRYLQQLLANLPTTGGGGGAGDSGGGSGDTFTPPGYGTDAGYIPDGTPSTIMGQPVIIAPGGGVYRSGGGTVTYQSGKGKYGKKPLE